MRGEQQAGLIAIPSAAEARHSQVPSGGRDDLGLCDKEAGRGGHTTNARDSNRVQRQRIYPDKVRLNCYYYRHYSFIKDIEMIFATVLGFKVRYAGEEI